MLLVKKKTTHAIYALKMLAKADLMRSGRQGIKQAAIEKRVLQELAERPHPFIITLMFSFQDVRCHASN